MQERDQDNGKNQQAKDAENIAVPKHQVSESRKPDKTADSAEREQRWQKSFAIFSLVFDGIVAISAIVGGYLIWQQMGLTRESNRLTQRALSESERQFNLQRRDAIEAAKEEQARAAAERAESERQAAAFLGEARRLNPKFPGLFGPSGGLNSCQENEFASSEELSRMQNVVTKIA